MNKVSLFYTALIGVAAAVVPVGVSGCGCTTEGVFGLGVVVHDGQGGPEVCDAAVTAHDGGYSEVLKVFSSGPGQCTYVGAEERTGTYAIDVVVGAKTASVQNVRVDSDGCHVKPQSVTVNL